MWDIVVVVTWLSGSPHPHTILPGTGQATTTLSPRGEQYNLNSFYSLGRRVDLDVVDDELRETLNDHIRERCSDHHWGGALLELHLLDIHRLGGGKVELRDAGPHQRSQVLERLECES